uniref:SFRICE_036474 n=1 Tax=Spodoptera frugiperda TaxID=7108 RepID=A0A2H1WH18_SPOFR
MSRSIIEKLTPILKHKWYDYAANRKLEDTPVLKLLSMFLNEEADKCSAYALPERDRDSAIDERRRRRVERTFMVNTRQKTSSERCPACKQHGHKLPDCSKYKQVDIDKRWDIAKYNNMCFRCLKSKHRRNMCRAPTCDVKECNMKHHKLLHKERNVNTAAPAPPAMTTHESVTSARETTSPHNRRAYLKIVPVTLSGPHARIHTYALLDDGSTVTLIDASAADILGADGPEGSMCIQGLGTEIKHERSRTVSLHIQGKYHSAPQKIEAARTVNSLEVTTQTVHAEDLSNCRHLDDIRSTLVYDRARPMILIGQDNWHLLEATKTRTGARDQPVASYTKLGWVLHGCQYTVNKETSTFCGHITIKENQEPTEEPCLEHRIPSEDLEQQKTLSTLKQKNRRLPDSSFKKKKQEAPTVPKSHLGTLERLDKNKQRAKNENDSPLSVISTHSAGAGTLRLRGKIKAEENPVVPKRKNKHKKLCTYFRRSFNSGNTTYPYSRLANQVRPHVLDYYGPMFLSIGRHKVKRNNLKCKAYRIS